MEIQKILELAEWEVVIKPKKNQADGKKCHVFFDAYFFALDP